MRKVRFLFFLVLLVSAGVGFWLFVNGRAMRLNSVDIVLDPDSHESFMFEKIQTGLQASLLPFTGLPFWKVSLEKVMDEVKKDKRVRLARVQREFPHVLRVIVVPQEPLLAYMDEQGRIYPVARDATLMPALALKDVPNFALLRGKEFATDEHLREQAVELMAAMPVDGHFKRDQISEILHNQKDGFSLFLANHSAEIKMGDADFDLKVSRVEKVLSYLHNRNLSGRTIDARFAKKVVVRVRGAQDQSR
jgi:cell division septal protein FtsQ